jgi:hypothetical protein
MHSSTHIQAPDMPFLPQPPSPPTCSAACSLLMLEERAAASAAAAASRLLTWPRSAAQRACSSASCSTGQWSSSANKHTQSICKASKGLLQVQWNSSAGKHTQGRSTYMCVVMRPGETRHITVSTAFILSGCKLVRVLQQQAWQRLWGKQNRVSDDAHVNKPQIMSPFCSI